MRTNPTATDANPSKRKAPRRSSSKGGGRRAPRARKPTLLEQLAAAVKEKERLVLETGSLKGEKQELDKRCAQLIGERDSLKRELEGVHRDLTVCKNDLMTKTAAVATRDKLLGERGRNTQRWKNAFFVATAIAVLLLVGALAWPGGSTSGDTAPATDQQAASVDEEGVPEYKPLFTD